MALGSVREAIYLIGLSSRLEFVDRRIAEEVTNLGNRVAAALSALKKSIN